KSETGPAISWALTPLQDPTAGTTSRPERHNDRNADRTGQSRSRAPFEMPWCRMNLDVPAALPHWPPRAVADRPAVEARRVGVVEARPARGRRAALSAGSPPPASTCWPTTVPVVLRRPSCPVVELLPVGRGAFRAGWPLMAAAFPQRVRRFSCRR